jgi:outer membrane protein OmpA-like peptidoglycan-associated protein
LKNVKRRKGFAPCRSKGIELMRRSTNRGPAAALLRVSFLFAGCCGCGFVPKTQFNACETQSRILSEQNKAQLAEIANLKAHSHKLEDQLLEAEKELTSLERRAAADQKRLANFQVERDRVQEEIKGLVRGAKITGVTPVRDDGVERLTKRFPMLRFDETTGAYKLDVDVLFEADGARITPESEKLLTEFAALFAEPEAAELRVMVVGRENAPSADGTGKKTKATPVGTGQAAEHRRSTERALAVAEFLRKVGLKAEQIGVSGMTGGAGGEKTPAAAEPTARGRRVEIFVMGKSTPIVGWGEPAGSRF